ncbi:MAG: chaperone, ATP12 [Proteobacteria bacterium]|nr:chaperone, ATP12 [Pseudomonadota bacterium]
MKRFWAQAKAVAAHREGEPGHRIELDGRPVRLPGGDPLHVASAALARAIAEEWQAAGDAPGGEFTAEATPLTRLAGTAQSRIAPDPAPTVDALVSYAGSDLLCYRATDPAALVRRQAEQWQPWLDWAALTYDAPLRVTSGIVHVEQSATSIGALRAAVAAQGAIALAGLGIMVPALGSLVLGLAIVEGGLDAQEASRLGALDELFQAELWGRDTEAERRREAVAADIVLAARFVALARGDTLR